VATGTDQFQVTRGSKLKPPAGAKMGVPRRPAFASHVPALAELEAHGCAAAAAPEEGHQAGAEEQPVGLPSAKLKAGAAGPGPPGAPRGRVRH
jgi:hypothetical protein